MIQRIVATLKAKAGQEAEFQSAELNLVAAVQAHRATEHYKTLGRAMAAFMDGPPAVLRLVELG